MFVAKTPEDLYSHVVNCASSMNIIQRGTIGDDAGLVCDPITDDNPNRTTESDEIWANLLPLPPGLAATRDPEHYPQLRINNTTVHLHMPNISVYSTQNLPHDITTRLRVLQDMNMTCGITVVRDVHQATVEQIKLSIKIHKINPFEDYASLYNVVYDKYDVYATAGFIPHNQIMNPATRYKLSANFIDIRATYCHTRGFGPTICKKYGSGVWKDRMYICAKNREIRVMTATICAMNCASCSMMCYGRAYTPDNVVYYCRCCAFSDVHISSNNLVAVKCGNKLKESIAAKLGTDAGPADQQLAKHICNLYRYKSVTKDIRAYYPGNWNPEVNSIGTEMNMGVIETSTNDITYIGITETWEDFMLCTSGRGANLSGKVIYYSVQM